MILDDKIDIFSIFLKSLITFRYKWLITSTNVHHLDTSLRHSLTSWMFRFVRTAPILRPRNPLPNSSLGKTNHSHNNPKNNFVRILTCSEFHTENSKKFFIHFPCSSESWIMAHDYESPYCYLSFIFFIHNSRSFPSKK